MSQASDTYVLFSPALVNRLSSMLTQNESPETDQRTEQVNFETQHICSTLNKLQDKFQRLVNKICENIENGKVFQSCFLESALEIIEITSTVIKSILQYIEHEANFIELGCNSLPRNAFNLVLLSYNHCKMSQSLYKNHFNEAAQLLGELFRKTFNLQKILGLLLSKFCAYTSKSKRKWQFIDIEPVLTSLSEISVSVDEMDKSLVATSWKMFVSFLVQLKKMVPENIDISKFLEILLNKIKDNFRQVLRLNTEISNDSSHTPLLNNKFMISYKMVNFFLDILTSLTDNYGISDCMCQEICTFLFEMYSNISSVANGTNKFGFAKEIKLEPILNHLDKVIVMVLSSYNFEPFTKFINSTEQKLSPIAVLIFLTRIVPILVKSNQMKQVDKVYMPVLSSHFQMVTHCFSEINLSQIIYIDDNKIRIYQQFCTNLCALVIAIPEQLFHSLEIILIENLLSMQSYKSTLAADVWCFMARFSSGELCLDHIKLLMRMVILIGNNFAVLSLISRLMEFLDEEQQASLFNLCAFNNEKNLEYWALFGSQLISFCDKPSNIFKEICEKCTCVLNRWIENACEVSSLILVIKYIKVLSSIFHDADTKLVSTCQSHISSLLFVLIRLWKSLPIESEDIFDGLLTLFSELLCFNTQFVTICNGIKDLANMTHILLDASLAKIKELYLSCKNTNIPLKCNFYSTIVDFLLSLKSQILTADTQSILAYLWLNIIQDSNRDWYLRFNILDSFEMFLAVTKHPHLMTEVCSKQETADLVKSHLRRDIVPLPNNVTMNEIVTNFAIKNTNQNLDLMEISTEDSHNTNSHELVQALERNVKNLTAILFAILSDLDIELIKKSIKELKNYTAQ